ncbi:unnamed protein product [Periconia digitata]|uniref:Asl1-like glycosyl hydrolase catalytic domain-containing protein n=1 Tax=Periconia digitata TaxID=1303443 RepID=A0A9W4UGX7_9PLEO|nr:unnamed protein product [Periconia digitata]
MPRNHRLSPTTTLLTLLTLLPPTALSQESKRGIAYVGNTHTSDNALLTSSSSPLTWYYNWSPYPPSQVPSEGMEFVPLIHGVDGAEDEQTARQLERLPESSTHLLSFNEPDGSTGSGGSAIEPKDAAEAYVKFLGPLREKERKWKISHPSTTGSGNGLEWLRKFNESCYDIDKDNGCPTDFIAAHWYGGFEGLAGWLGTLNEFYNTNTSRDPPLKIWITELALPQMDADANTQMMNQTLPYLDQLDYVEKYAWFGAFRPKDANEWTGDGVALFNSDGGLTKLGALYMGGDKNGFKEGQQGEGEGGGDEDGARRSRISWSLLLSLTFAAGIFSTL